MNIKIIKLELTNFKCFRHKEFRFDSDITTIRGRNGAGKTTIADAILWCLFGKNTMGQSDFDLKTHDAEGRPIPHLDHSVELVLSVAAESQREITLKRTLKETWLKKRGSDEQVFKNNTTEYMVNGDALTTSDYKKFIAQLISEEVFRAITNPSYFPSLKWQQQREFLTQMAGDITPDTSNAEFAALLKQLTDNDEDIIAYRKHLSYQIKKVKDSLDKIPVRLEEQNKALPELLDWEALTVQSMTTGAQIKSIDERILQIKSGNGSDVRKEQLRNNLDTLYDKKRQREDALRRPLYEQRTANTNAIAEATRQFNTLLNNQRDLEAAIRSFDTLSERCNETLARCERDAEQIRKEWAENLSRSASWNDDDDAFCPTCGQPLPQDQLRERQQKVIERLNKSKAEVKAFLTDRANKVKALRAQAEEQLKDYAANKQEAEKNLAKTKQEINEVFAQKQNLEKVTIPTIEEALASDEEYLLIVRQIEETKEAIQNASVTTEEDQQALEALESERVQYVATLSQLNSQLATYTQYYRIQSLIEGINEEQQDLIRQLSDLERREDIARQYQDRQNAILEERINQRFSLVKWRMFRTVNNGGDPFDEPFCECYVDGVAYHDGLNQAARLNAGLDIINTLCRHHNVSAPILLDNSESTINILQTIGQQIRLQVADTDLQIL